MTLEADLEVTKGDFLLSAAFTAPANGVTAIFGRSGAGKTTLLRVLAGLERGATGTLEIGGRVWQGPGVCLRPYQRRVGFVFQNAALFEHLSVKKNLEYGFKRIHPSQRKLAFEDIAAWLELERFFSRKPASLSAGERQRVAIGRALLTSPQILLMDEPLASLDLPSRREILPFLDRVRSELKIPVLYVSHEPDEVARLADHLILLEEGEVTAVGPIAEMLTRTDLPLAHSEDAETLIEAEVDEHDSDWKLSYLRFPGGRLTVARGGLRLGQSVRVRILARDVSVTLEHQTATSILNILPAVVDELRTAESGAVTVRLDVGGAALLSRITQKSAAALELAPGRRVYAQIKSVAVLA